MPGEKNKHSRSTFQRTLGTRMQGKVLHRAGSKVLRIRIYSLLSMSPQAESAQAHVQLPGPPDSTLESSKQDKLNCCYANHANRCQLRNFVEPKPSKLIMNHNWQSRLHDYYLSHPAGGLSRGPKCGARGVTPGKTSEAAKPPATRLEIDVASPSPYCE